VSISERTTPAMAPAAPTGTGHRPSRARTRAALVVAFSAALIASLFTITTSPAQADVETLVQAEAFTAQSGAAAETTTDTGGGQNVAYLADGDWLSYANLDLGSTGSLNSKVRVASASASGGTLELRADSLTGTVLATFPIKSTGGYQNWTTLTASGMSMLTGRHTVFVVVHSSQPGDFVNLNWFSLSSANTPMPPMTMPPATPGAWISVDPVKQAADTRAFFARTPKPITGNPVRRPEFNAGCTVSHHANDDPIVFPGQFGASHNHTFMGATTTNAASTLASLKAGGTTCNPVGDKSAYWVPTLYQNGRVVDPLGSVTVYYGSRLDDPSTIQPFPEGFRMITGDAKNQVDTPDHQGNHFFCAGNGGEVGRSADGLMPVCAPTAVLNRQITFADCWDGVHLDSPDHKAHVSNGGPDGACPTAFPVPIPNISFVIAYPLNTNTDGITLASGTTFSMHADFFNAWDPDAQAERVRNCLNQAAKCDSAGNF
jgi:uncharacterized protein DUF1996/carbohydrate binding protein with CBM6 domain